MPVEGSKDTVPLGKQLIRKLEREEEEWQKSTQIADRWPLLQYGSQGAVVYVGEVTCWRKGRICILSPLLCRYKHNVAYVEQAQVRNTHVHLVNVHKHTVQVLQREHTSFSLRSLSGAVDCTGFQGSVRGGREGN